MPKQYVTIESLQSMWAPQSEDDKVLYSGIEHEFFCLRCGVEGRMYRWSFHTMQTELRGTEPTLEDAKLVCAKFAADYINRALIGLV